MTTKQIDYCIEVAHTLNFSRAADNLFVSQPTFSYQIRLLEEEIGFTIFERNGKGAALTPAGAQFVTFLTSMREDLKRAIEQGQNFSAKYKGVFSARSYSPFRGEKSRGPDPPYVPVRGRCRDFSPK